MINMMYLVLTALLALNVSVEVLEAFVTIDKGLERNIVITNDKNASILRDLHAAYAENSQKAEPWKLKAEEVHQKSLQLFQEIQDLKVKIVLNGEEENPAVTDSVITPELIEDLGNTNVSSRVMVADGKGASYGLREKINELREYLIGVAAKDTAIANSIKSILNTDDPVENKGDKKWETANFLGVPLISAIAILSKMQLDILNCEGEVLNYLKHQVGASDFKFSHVNAAVIPVSQYVTKGSEYSAQVFLSAYDPTLNPELVIDGRTYHTGPDGKIPYSVIANEVGEVNKKGIIKFLGPQGMTTTPVDISFRVVEPLAIVSASKMNVLYRGVDNPVTLVAAGAQASDIEHSIVNGTISKRGNEYIVRPGNGNTCDISISVNKKPMGTTRFRVKDVPKPIPSLDGIAGKVASKGDLVASQGVLAKMPPDFDFDMKFTVVSFTVSATINGYVSEESSDNFYFNSKQKQIFNGLRPNQRVYIIDIKAKDPDGKTVELSDISLKIR